MTRRHAAAALVGLVALLGAAAARADAVDTLRSFVRDVKSARASFTQTVTSPDGAKTRNSSGSFSFERPNRFRFAYDKPFEQLLVSDGKTVWLYDADLNQVTERRFDQALGATPAALLAGAGLERDFTLAAQAARGDGLDWVQAKPKATEGQVRELRIGFRGKDLAALEIVDAFGQRSLLRFAQLQAGVAVPAETFRFTPPAGADVIRP